MCYIRTSIADHDPGVLQRLKDVLSSAGYRVHRAPNQRGAAEIVRQRPIDVATLDLKTPFMNGLEALEEIKRDQIDGF